MNFEELEKDSTELDHFSILHLLALLRNKVMRSCLSHDAKMNAVKDLQSTELKVVADLNPSKEQIDNKRSK